MTLMTARAHWLRAALVLPLLAGSSCTRAAAEPPLPGRGGEPERGRVLVREYGCGACHDIPGVSGANGRVGPSLRAIGARHYIGGVLPNTEDAMIRWIQDPRAVTPRTGMPDVGVTPEHARHIAAFLYTLAGERRPQRAVPAGHMLRARALLQEYGCQSCHVIPGVPGAAAHIGPPLDGVGSRTFLGGVVPNTPENMVAWLMNPRSFEPMTAMPALGLTEDHAREIAAYLYTLP
jgi:cytochrome c2